MRGCRLLWLLVVLVLTGTAAIAQTVVTVKPGDMNGWVIAAPYYANAYLTNVVPSPLDNPNPTDIQWPGAFYVQTNDSSYPDHSGQGWIGNISYNGVYCRDIQNMFYYTYTEPWGWNVRTHHYARQPTRIFMLTTKNGPGDANRRMFVFCPWGLLDSGENQANYGVWQKQRCMADCPTTTDPAFPGQGDRAYPGWYEFVTNKYGDWDYFFNPTTGIVKNASIVEPLALASGWDADPKIEYAPGQLVNQMACTPTGAGLNLWVGARAANNPGIFGEVSFAWYLDSYMFAGFADNFSITIGGQETVYDFQGGNDVPGQYLLTSGDEINHAVTRRGKPLNYYTLHGVVIDDNSPDPFNMFDLGQNDFWIVDATGTHVKIIASQHGVQEGWYVSVQGMIEPYPTRVYNATWLGFDEFPAIWTTYERITRQQ